MVVSTIFITLAKFRERFTHSIVARSDRAFSKLEKDGVKILARYWTLGRYDAVVVTEGPDEQSIMKAFMRWGDIVSTETLVAVPREEAVKLIEK
jgi:uncharacterized protein with GYD domain